MLILALTTRGFMEEDFEKVADLIHESINVTQFICSKLDGGAKAPLKVRHFSFMDILNNSLDLFIPNICSGFQRSPLHRSRSFISNQRSR